MNVNKYLNRENALVVLSVVGLSGLIYFNIPAFISYFFPLCDCAIR